MRPNNLRKIFAGGGTVLNGWLAIASTYSAEMMAHQGFESVTVDLQHGPVDFQAALGMLPAISPPAGWRGGRGPQRKRILPLRLLAAGAYGVICPMITPRAEAGALVNACRY